MLEMAHTHVTDYEAAKVNRPARPRQSDVERWKPPENGTVKLNCDAALRSGYGTGLGSTLRDHDGMSCGNLHRRLMIHYQWR